MEYFVIIRGPAGVGKSTIAEKLAVLINGLHISIDKILEENNMDTVKGKSIPEENFLKSNKIAVKICKNSEKTAIFDGNFYHRKQMDDLIKKMDCPCYAFTLKASLNKCMERDKTRKNPLG